MVDPKRRPAVEQLKKLEDDEEHRRLRRKRTNNFQRLITGAK
jgi:hypothetical protein